MSLQSFWRRLIGKPRPSRDSGKDRPEAKKPPHNPIGKLHLPDWQSLLAGNRCLWDESRERAAHGPSVLMATSLGGLPAFTVVESVLAAALTLRGADVHTFLCDRVMPACFRAENMTVSDPDIFTRYEWNSHKLCQDCPNIGHHVYDPLALRSHHFSDFVSGEQRARAKQLAHEIPYAQLEDFELDGRRIGEHAKAGALRYYATGNLDAEPSGEMVCRRFFEGALLTDYATEGLFAKHPMTAACFHHGIDAPQGIIGEVCRARGVRVANWNVAYRKRCFIFSHGDTYHHTLLSEPVETWENIPWNDAMERDIMEYIKSRWHGARDWIFFHEKPDEEIDRFLAETGLDSSKPIIGLLTNVMWDAQLHYRANAFPNLLTWAIETIDYFSKRPDVQLLIRVHPAEIRGTLPSRQPIIPEIRKVFPTLPKNVFIIPPESPVSTYAAMLKCDSAIIYGTKTGVELTSMGKPVVVGGEAWIRNKGITLDASTRTEYFQQLDRLPLGKPLDPQTIQRAQKYAYHFFFRRMIPLSFMEPGKGQPPYRLRISSIEELMPGADQGLDVICNGILNGGPFVYPAEELGVESVQSGAEPVTELR